MTARHGERAALQEKDTARIEAFSDGVFAIAITLLILDIKVPHLGDGASELGLLSELGRQWKAYVAYLMSFSVILVMWASHHRIFALVRAADQPFLFWNGLLLMFVSIVPFPTSLLSEYFMTSAAKTGAAVYAGHGLLISLAFQALWRHAIRTPRLLMAGTEREVAWLTRRYRFGPLMYAVAFAAAFVSAWLSIGLCLLFVMFFSFLGLTRSLTLRIPHPLILLLGAVAVAAALTWALPAGVYERRQDPATGRQVVVAGTYHAVPQSRVGPFAAVMAVARGFIDAADVVAVVLFVGGAWVVIDRLGTLGRLIAALVGRFRRRGLVAVPAIALFFASMGALENMQEEIIPLVPVLLVLGRGLGVDAVTVVAMSAGAAMIGSAFGPTNPFQAGIAMKLAQLSPLSGGGVRLAMFVAAFVLWVGWTMRYASTRRVAPEDASAPGAVPVATIGAASLKDALIFLIVLSPMAFYVYGAIALDWGFNELSAGFFIAAFVAGLFGGLGLGGTVAVYLEGMQSLLPAAMLIAVARSISVVLGDGHIIDTILHGLAAPLGHATAIAAALLMIPFHVLIHIVVPSVSGQAVLTMPVLVPLSDLLGISRQVTVLAYQTGAGLTELLTPTNGALMAVLLAAGVPFQRWFKFALVGVGLSLVVGVVGMLIMK